MSNDLGNNPYLTRYLRNTAHLALPALLLASVVQPPGTRTTSHSNPTSSLPPTTDLEPYPAAQFPSCLLSFYMESLLDGVSPS